jgi:Zn-dependent membrane protease YugP
MFEIICEYLQTNIVKILIFSAIISLIASIFIKKTYRKYSEISIDEGYNGYEIARLLLDEAGLEDVQIKMIGSVLREYYNSEMKILYLPRIVYSEHSIAAVGIAIHEAGHAIQAENSVLPSICIVLIARCANLLATIGIWLTLLGAYSHILSVGLFGTFILAVVFGFQIISLPVEFSASSKSLEILERKNILNCDAVILVKKVSDAAAFTFVSKMINPVIEVIEKTSSTRYDRYWKL